jgi:LysM repeat protein
VKRYYICIMRFPVTLFVLLNVVVARAQSNELIIQGQTGGLYLEHSVVVKETWYSVGRLYNIDPKVLAQYNHLTFGHPLAIAEVVKVPLTAVNFSQDGKKGAAESLVPVYHIVLEKEWLYRISVNHNKVPIPVLEKWNHVKGDQVHAGLHMIVGYLKVKTALSALAKVAAPAVAAAAPAAGGGKAGVDSARVDKPKAAEPKMVEQKVAEQKMVEEKVMVDSPARAAGTPVSAPVSHPASAPPVSTPVSAPHFSGGRFKGDYTDGGKSVSGQAGIFKSSSGWQDGKYYVLINNIPVGTIVKITDQATGKAVFAKVLGQLPDMKESAGLTVRLSNAGAAELGEGDGKFGVGVSY